MSDNIRKQLIQTTGNVCSVCGKTVERLELDHIIPMSSGGEHSIDNLQLVCASCHRVLHPSSQLRGFEFQHSLVRLLENHPGYRNVSVETEIGSDSKSGVTSVDISAEERQGDSWVKLLIECKAQSSFTGDRLHKVLSQITSWRKFDPNSQLVLAFPGELSPNSHEVAKEFNVRIWDLVTMGSIFEGQIDSIESPKFHSMMAFIQRKKPIISPEEELMERLEQCKPGRANWSHYQKLVGEILERLFCPPLSTPLTEKTDFSQVNRRDFIFPNYVGDGFWAFIREQYTAEFIIVDAKNYTRKIKKEEVLQIANYLKPHGAGLFALIVCRQGADRGALHTMREVWGYHRKLIVVLDNNDIQQMLRNKTAGVDPAEVIRNKIMEFRLEI